MLMLAALLLGGGGRSAPLHNLAIEILAVGLLAFIFWNPAKLPADRLRRAAMLLLLLVLATPLLQLMPLPYPVWSELPGRDFAAQVDQLTGNRSNWRPVSLDPEATLLGAAALLPAVAMFIVTLRLAEWERRSLAVLIIAVAVVSMAIGAFQLAAGGQAFQIYETPHRAFAPGLFINRNHQADFLLVALLLASSLIWRQASMTRAVRWSLWLVAVLGFSAGVIATTSRMGFILLPLAIAGSLAFAPLSGLLRRKAAILSSAALALAGLAFVATSAATRQVIARFDTLSDLRYEFWAETIVAAREYLPWGTGLGTFSSVYKTIEDLNKVGPTSVNHAHNDYLQILLEAGLWGCLLVLLFLGLLAWLAVRRGYSMPFRYAALFSILIILLHSLVDYPLRMLSLLTLFGFLCGLLFPANDAAETGKIR